MPFPHGPEDTELFLPHFLTMFVTPFILIAAQLAWAAPSQDRDCLKPLVATSWYPSWHSSDYTVHDISWTMYNSVKYAFASTTPDPSVIGFEDSDKAFLPQFVEEAHMNGVKAMLAIGGWGGSKYFSPAVATEANRTAFAKAIMGVVSQYGLDGIEFDWEYPAKQGIGCNVIAPNDSDNFLLFLQTLRDQDCAQDITISAAVSIVPFIGLDGTPMKDVSAFDKVLDYIEIMNYDIWGSWSTGVGPNAPLNDSCAAPQNQQGSAVSAVRAWTTAGFPANKIILGVAAYGHSFHVNTTNALDASGNLVPYPPFDKTKQPSGDKWDSTTTGVDVCGVPNVVGGIFNFWGLIDAGFLDEDGTAASGIDYRWDNCSMTPYVYNPTTQVMVSFDDAASFTAKGVFIREAGLAGFAMWQSGGDSDDILTQAISGYGVC